MHRLFIMATWKMHALAQRYLYSFARYSILNLSASGLEAKVSAGFTQIFQWKKNKRRNMQYLTNVYWSKGEVAAKNQDSVLLLQALTARGRILMAAVCDGMGGYPAGELASGMVTSQLQQWFFDSLLRAVARKKPRWVIRRSMERLVYQMQKCLQNYGNQEQIKLGTTMTVLILWEKRYFVFHLGDSCVYGFPAGFFRKGKMTKLTKDHLTANNKLTKCVGSFGYFKPDYELGTCRKGDGFLVCSDGFRRRTAETELAAGLSSGAIYEERQIENRLAQIALLGRKRGEVDNQTAIYVKVQR